MNRLIGFCLLLSAVTFTGCTPASSNPKTYPVTGTVTRNGNPVVGAKVIFVTLDQAGQSAMGTTDESGKYQLSTFEPNDGALPAPYVIRVMQFAQPNAPAVASERFVTEEQINAQYNPDEKAPPPPKNQLPEKYSSEFTSGLKHTVPESATTYDIVIDNK